MVVTEQIVQNVNPCSAMHRKQKNKLQVRDRVRYMSDDYLNEKHRGSGHLWCMDMWGQQ